MRQDFLAAFFAGAFLAAAGAAFLAGAFFSPFAAGAAFLVARLLARSAVACRSSSSGRAAFFRRAL